MRKLLWLVVLTLSSSGIAQVICIDPGHPSEVGQGTTGKKLTEIHAAWVEARLLKTLLEKQGMTVFMTKRSENQFVRNRARAAVANKNHADLMVRLHCDSSNGSGFTCYCPTQPGTSEGVRGPSREVIESSQAKAKLFHAALAASLKDQLSDNGLKSDLATAVGGRQGALTGSVFSKVPVVLIEMVVLNNPRDEAFLLSKKGQDTMARALRDGVLAALSGRAK